jgi:hypothetical protein
MSSRGLLHSSMASVMNGSNEALTIQQEFEEKKIDSALINSNTIVPAPPTAAKTAPTISRADVLAQIGGLMLDSHHPALLRLGNSLRYLTQASDVAQLVDVEAKTTLNEDLSSITVNLVFVDVTKEILLQLVDREQSYGNTDTGGEGADRRARLLHYFLIDEIAYVKALKLIIDRFLNPFKALIMLMKKTDALNSTISTLECVDLFSNIEDLYEISNYTLINVIRELQNAGCIVYESDVDGKILKFELFVEESERAFDIFCKIWNQKIDLLRAYFLYLSNFRRSLKLVKFLRSHRQSFVDFVDVQTLCLGKDLYFSDLLLLPLMRFPQYFHAFYEFTQTYTYSNPPTSLQISYQTLDVIFSQSQLQKYSVHARMRVAFIQEKLFLGAIALVTSKRFFVKYGQLTKTYNKTSFKFSKDKLYSFFLFNDILVYADPDGAAYKLKHVIDLSKVRVSPHDDPDNLHFKVEGGAKDLILKAPDLESKESWMNAISVFADLASQQPSTVTDFEETITKQPKTKFVRDLNNGWFKVQTVVGLNFYFQEKTGQTSLCPPSQTSPSGTTPTDLLPNELLGKKCKYDGCRRFAMKFSGRGVTCVEHTSIPEEDLKDSDLDMTASMLVRSMSGNGSGPSLMKPFASGPIQMKRGMSVDEGKRYSDAARESIPPPPPDHLYYETNQETGDVQDEEEDSEAQEAQEEEEVEAPVPARPMPIMIPRGPPPQLLARGLGGPRRGPPPPVEDSGDNSIKAKMLMSATPIVPGAGPSPMRSAGPPPARFATPVPLAPYVNPAPAPAAPAAPPAPPVTKQPPAIPEKRKSSAPEIRPVIKAESPQAPPSSGPKGPPPPLRNINEALRDQLLNKARGRLLPTSSPPTRIAPSPNNVPLNDEEDAKEDEKPSEQEEVDDASSEAPSVSAVNKVVPSRPEKKLATNVSANAVNKPPPPLKPKQSLSSTLTPKDIAMMKPKPKPGPAVPTAKPVQVIAPAPKPKPVPIVQKPIVEQPTPEDSSVNEAGEEEEDDDMQQLYDASTGEPTLWFQIYDKELKKYYFWNDDTEESMWTMPPGLKLG